jgi:hypothetical protein
MVESTRYPCEPCIRELDGVYTSIAIRMRCSDHSDHIGPSPAESALVIDFTSRPFSYRLNRPVRLLRGSWDPRDAPAAVRGPGRYTIVANRYAQTHGLFADVIVSILLSADSRRQQLPVFHRFFNRVASRIAAARAATCIRRAAPPAGEESGCSSYTRGTHYTDDQSRPHCAATPTPATAHAHVLHARHHAPC